MDSNASTCFCQVLAKYALPPVRVEMRLKTCARHRILVHFVGRDDVDRNAFVFGHGAHVVGRHHAGVVGTVGEHDDHFAAGNFRGIAQGQQQAVVERGIVAGHGLAKPEDGVVAIARERRGARQIAAEGVDRHRIRCGPGRARNRRSRRRRRRIRDTCSCWYRRARRRWCRRTNRCGRRRPSLSSSAAARRVQRARGAVLQHLHRRLVAFAEGVDLLRDAVFGNPEIAGFRPLM